jgi:peptide/nickel transport system substrate-binding protein
MLIWAALVQGHQGCARPEARRDNVLRVALEARPGPLDPRHSVDAASGRIGELVFSRLVKQDRDLEIVPDLAERWTVEQGGRRIRFFLREGVRFHDGSTLDAADVEFTFRSLLDPGSASPKRATYGFLESVEALDERTVEFRLRQPNAPFFSNLLLGILPSEAARDATKSGAVPVGSGPFRVVENADSSVIRLAAFERYYGGRPELDGIEFRHVPEPTMRVLELQTGGLDFLQNDLPPEFVPALRRDPNLRVLAEPGINCSYLGMNLRHPALAKLEVRTAISHALDRSSIQSLLLRDTASLADTLLAPSVLGTNPRVRAPEHDLEQARRLLDRAGYVDPDGAGPEPRLSLSYKTSLDKLRLRIAEVLRRNLGEAGIQVQIQSFEFGTLMNDIRTGNFELYTLTWVGLAEPDGLYNIFHSSALPPNGANRVWYANPIVDRLLEQGRVELDRERRRTLYSEVHRILGQELPLIPLWYTNNVACLRADVEGFELSPVGSFASMARVRFARPVRAAGGSSR